MHQVASAATVHARGLIQPEFLKRFVAEPPSGANHWRSEHPICESLKILNPQTKMFELPTDGVPEKILVGRTNTQDFAVRLEKVSKGDGEFRIPTDSFAVEERQFQLISHWQLVECGVKLGPARVLGDRIWHESTPEAGLKSKRRRRDRTRRFGSNGFDEFSRTYLGVVCEDMRDGLETSHEPDDTLQLSYIRHGLQHVRRGEHESGISSSQLLTERFVIQWSGVIDDVDEIS